MVAKNELPAGNVAQGTALKETQGSMGFGAFLVRAQGIRHWKRKNPLVRGFFNGRGGRYRI